MSVEIVAQAKADLLAAGKDLSGDNGSFLITMEAAFRLGLGVVDKPNGHHAEYPVGSGQFFSVDGIMDRAGNFFDVLINGGAGGTNVPTWQPNGTVEALRYRPAVSILGAPPVVVPPVDPGIPVPSLSLLLTRIDDLEDLIGQLQGGFSDATKQTQAMVADVYQAQGDTMKAVEKLIAAVSNIGVPVVKFPNYSGKVSIPFVGDRTITLKPEGQ